MVLAYLRNWLSGLSEDWRRTVPSPFVGMDPFLEDPAIFPDLHDLQAVFDRCYEVGLYARRVKYAERTLVPPLSPAQAQWTQEVLRTKGLVSESA